MNTDLKGLLELQKIDSNLHFLRNLREKRPQELERERTKLSKSEELVALIDAEIKQLRVECDRAELDVRRKRDDIEKNQIALNQVKTNHEYQVLTDAIKRIEADCSAAEEAVLEKLEENDGLRGEKAKAEETAAGLRKDFAEREAEVQNLVQEIQGKITTLEAEREQKLVEIDRDALETYERVLRRYGDSALALVDGKCCQGCHMSVTTQEINQLMIGEKLIQCRNCMKILYLATAMARH